MRNQLLLYIFNLFGSGFFLFSFINVVNCKLLYRGWPVWFVPEATNRSCDDADWLGQCKPLEIEADFTVYVEQVEPLD